ncbi:Alpha/Beta hydrolase protein [Cadophora sp. MPI-SDFR-AT-0126]|nr:Alpha/Beta hydrolase protein [Leotiomycetes sp. MPI-SDFR-AT-0126]
MSQLSLRLKAMFFRAVLSLFTMLDLYLSRPLPGKASFGRKIQSTVSVIPGSIGLLFYTPPSYNKKRVQTSSELIKKHPLLVNFHGGGFMLGHAGDDARWFTAVTSSTDAVVASTNYRLAPEYPFPIAVEDCVSAVLWLWRHADEFNIDISKTAFSGFSAGGNLTYTVSIRLHQEIARLRREGALNGLERGRLVNLVAVYGGVDWTQTRAEREASNPNLIHASPPFLLRLFDEAYLSTKPDLRSPLLSPGVAPDELLQDSLPQTLVIINCSGDHLLVESEKFRERLIGLGKDVKGYVVEGEGHGWDKKPTFFEGDQKRDDAYKYCVEALQSVWEET